VKRGFAAHVTHDWRRRLRPAAPVLLFCTAAVLGSLGLLSIAFPGGDSPGDPPAARPLPAGALVAEHHPAPEGPPARGRRAHRRPHLADVVDRDAASPRRIRIPAIGVSAPVIPLHLEHGGRMQTPRNFGATGWYEPGREPGEKGPAVIAGHVDSKSGPAVFYKLRRLRPGDVIRVVRADRSAVRFRVEGLERWPKSEFPTRKVFGRTRVSTLRLVTCSGNFDPSSGHYEDNTIVYAVRTRVRVR
jgi:sortase (surface protein transpeptidase)